jgi:hypothetical protein
VKKIEVNKMEYVVLLEENEYEGKIDIEEPVIFAVTDSKSFIEKITKEAFIASQSKGMGFSSGFVTIAEKEYSTRFIVNQGRKKGEYETLLLTMEEFQNKLIQNAIVV